MLIGVCQRWRLQRARYRPAGEVIPTRRYEVAIIKSDTLARQFVERHHYSGTYPAARFRTGLFRSGELVGVAVLSQPASQAALQAALPYPDLNRAELGRFVLHDSVEANGESWFLARTWHLARIHGFDAVVMHSDPAPRTNALGDRVFAGHVGTIYQATNARYVGRTPRRTWRLLPNGAVLTAREISKLRARERGFDGVVQRLVEHGAAPPDGDWETWFARTLQATTRTFRHPGTHRYLWALDAALRRRLPGGCAYPRFTARHDGHQLSLFES